MITWHNQINSLTFKVLYIMLSIIPLILEIFQFYKLAFGTFDFYDLLFYYIAFLSSSLIFNKLLINFKTNKL